MFNSKKIQIESSDVIDNIDGIINILCNNNNEWKEYFLYYFYKKFFLNNNMYPYIDKHIPDFTRHDFSHIHGVLHNIYEIIKDRLLFKIGENGEVKINEGFSVDTSISSYGFTFWELYYLVMATIYHDAGLMFGKEDHGVNLRKIFEFEKSIKLKGYIMEDICNIALAHTGKEAIDNLKPTRIFSPNNETIIYPKFIAALLRIADEFHEGAERTNIWQMRKFIDKKNKVYHYFSWMVYNVIFDNIDKTITLYLTIRFEEENKKDFKIELMEFIIKRTKKYLKEIKYCITFDIKNMLFQTLKLDIIYYTKENEDKQYNVTIENDKDMSKFEVDLKKIFREEIL